MVFGSLGVLLLVLLGSLLDGPARYLPRATGLSRAQRDRGFTLVATGDVLTHGPVLRQASAYGRRSGQPYDFRPMFADLRPIVASADLALCHLEVPLSRDGRGIASWPAFNAPPQLAAALRWAGYDACSTASNHAMDKGPPGIAATLDVMDAAGGDAGGLELTHVGGAHVEVGTSPRAGTEVLRGESGPQLIAHFVAAGADAGAHGHEGLARVRAQRLERTRCDPGRGASPAGMHGGGDPAKRIHDEDGKTIGGLDPEQPAGPEGDGGIRGRRLVPGRPRHRGSVDLPHQEQAAARSEGGSDASARLVAALRGRGPGALLEAVDQTREPVQRGHGHRAHRPDANPDPAR